jgi:hypothetical protein
LLKCCACRICYEGRIRVLIIAIHFIKKGTHLCYPYNGNFGLGDANLYELEESNEFSKGPSEVDDAIGDGVEEEEEKEKEKEDQEESLNDEENQWEFGEENQRD